MSEEGDEPINNLTHILNLTLITLASLGFMLMIVCGIAEVVHILDQGERENDGEG